MKIEKVIEIIKQWIKENRTGSIKINFFKGGIVNLNLIQSVKTETKGEREHE